MLLHHESDFQVSYCSTECQKTHWKEGGHKKQCNALMTAEVSKRTSGAAAVARAGASDDHVCIICLDSEPLPIQSGCACRGDAGLAHVACRILAAEAKEKSRDVSGWQECPTCGQVFTGQMALGLAVELFRRVRGQLDVLPRWVYAAGVWSRALLNEDRPAEAEAVLREILSVFDRKKVSTVAHAPGLRSLLGRALSNQGKCAEAQHVFERYLTDVQREHGPDSVEALEAASCLGDCLRLQEKYAEAIPILRDTLERSKRVNGPEHSTTMDNAAGLAGVYGDAHMQSTRACHEAGAWPRQPSRVANRDELCHIHPQLWPARCGRGDARSERCGTHARHGI
jgi:hypothetical protein